MKHQGGTGVLKMLVALAGKPMTAAVREEYERLLNYLRKNEHRMDYPQYLRSGWQIATGSMESACKRRTPPRRGESPRVHPAKSVA